MRSKFFISVSAVIIIGIVVFCVIRSSSSRKGRPERIILISIDTCRSDYLSSYGYQQKTTPNIDQLAEAGGNENLTQEIKGRLKLFRQGRSYSEQINN